MVSKSSSPDLTPTAQFRQYLTTLGPSVMLGVVAIAMIWKMLRDGLIFQSHDIHYHLVWLQHFSRQLAEGIWYPRWLAGTNYGYGSPTFVFYPPLVYYLGSCLKFLGLNGEQALIALFWIALWGAGIGFYLYGQPRWGKRAALGGALLYITAPYFAFNLYVRGVVPETTGLMAIPLGLWLTDQAMARPRWNLALAVFFALLALIHLPSFILYTIAWGIYILSFLGRRSWKIVGRSLVAAGLGVGLVSFYLLPALSEQSAVSLNQLSATTGGVAANLVGTSIKTNFSLMRSQITPLYLHQAGVVMGLAIALGFWWRFQALKARELWYWVGTAGVLLLLMSYLALPLWQSSHVLQVIQQPWRLLGLLSFCGAALGAMVLQACLQHSSRWQRGGLVLAIALVLLGNGIALYRYSQAAVGMHRPGHLLPAIVGEQLKGKTYVYLHTALCDPYSNQLMDAKEYRPQIPRRGRAPWPELAQPPVAVAQGQATVTVQQWDSYDRSFEVRVDQSARLDLRTYRFPAWNLVVNGRSQALQMSDRGNLVLDLPPGQYQVRLYYGWTRALALGCGLSLLSLLLLIGFGWFFLPAAPGEPTNRAGL